MMKANRPTMPSGFSATRIFAVSISTNLRASAEVTSGRSASLSRYGPSSREREPSSTILAMSDGCAVRIDVVDDILNGEQMAQFVIRHFYAELQFQIEN